MFSISETLSWSKAAFAQHFKLLAGVSALNLIPIVVLELIPKAGIGADAVSALISLVSVVLSYFVMAMMYHIASVAVVGGDISREAVIARAKTMFFPMLWVSVFTMLFTFAWAPTIVGLLIASIFGTLSLPVLFVENKRGAEAVATSITLIKGKIGRFIGFGIVVLLIALVPLILVTFLVGSIVPVNGVQISTTGNIIMNAFTYLFVTPVIAMASFGAYRGLRAITPEPEADVFTKRVRFVKICAAVGLAFVLILATALIVALLFGSFGP